VSGPIIDRLGVKRGYILCMFLWSSAVGLIGAAQNVWMLAGFLLFRLFDILKPPPVRQLERLPAGTGIMMDDVAAGVLALATGQVLLLLLKFAKP